MTAMSYDHEAYEWNIVRDVPGWVVCRNVTYLYIYYRSHDSTSHARIILSDIDTARRQARIRVMRKTEKILKLTYYASR